MVVLQIIVLCIVWYKVMRVFVNAIIRGLI